MFYSDAILSKKGPLAKVWLAAHERKLTKAQLLQTSITRSTQAIVEQDEAPLALRLSGQLLLGVVRIYSRKARYLLDDCNEALMKIKLAFRPGNVDLPTTQTVTSHALLTLPDTLTELDLLLPPDPTLLSQTLGGGADPTLLSNPFDFSMEYARGLRDEDDPLSQFQQDDTGEQLDFALHDRSFSVERGRDAVSVGLEEEFSVRGLPGGEDLDFGFDMGKEDVAPFGGGEDDDGLGGGFGDTGGLDFGFGEEEPIPNNDFAEALLRGEDGAGEEPVVPTTAKLIRKRKLLISDPEIEISKKDYSQHQKDTSNIVKKQRFLPRHASLMSLLDARMHGRLADLIFFPPTIHPDLRSMLNPESLRKRKRMDDPTLPNGTPKRARIENPVLNVLDEPGYGDGGFGDEGYGDGGFGEGGGFGDSFAEDHFHPAQTPPRSPSLVDETAFAPATEEEEDEAPTALTGSLSHATIATAQLLQTELADPSGRATLGQLTKRGVSGGAGVRDDAVRMFFEVLVLASRDVVKVRQERGFGEIEVRGKEGLWGGKFGVVEAVG